MKNDCDYRAIRFGALGLWPIAHLAKILFKAERTRALFAGLAAHSFLPLERFTTSAMAIILALAGHAYGWPIIRAGSGELPKALQKIFLSLGGEVITDLPIFSLQQLPPSKVVLFDLTPRQILAIDGLDLSKGYRRKLKSFRYGPSVFKVDWALHEPIPWQSSV